LLVVPPRDPLERVLHDFDEVVEIGLAVFIETAVPRGDRVRKERLEAKADRTFERVKKTVFTHRLLAQQGDHLLVGHLLWRVVGVAVAAGWTHPSQQRAGNREAEISCGR
jgi:hypothetical protein